MCGKGQPRWWVLPLEMLSMCTCYSQFHWRWFGSRVTFLFHNMALSCPCMFQDLTGPRVGSQLFHLSSFYWHTCRVAVGAYVTSSLDHVSHFYWSTWHEHNTPCVFLLLDQVSQCCTSVCQYFSGPCVTP